MTHIVEEFSQALKDKIYQNNWIKNFVESQIQDLTTYKELQKTYAKHSSILAESEFQKQKLQSILRILQNKPKNQSALTPEQIESMQKTILSLHAKLQTLEAKIRSALREKQLARDAIDGLILVYSNPAKMLTDRQELGNYLREQVQKANISHLANTPQEYQDWVTSRMLAIKATAKSVQSKNRKEQKLSEL